MTTQKTIGDIGECIAKNIFRDLGYDIVGFGKAMHKTKQFDYLSYPVNVVPDSSIGYSYGYFPFHIDSEYAYEWRDSEYPHWSDLPYIKIIDLAKKCKKNFNKCPIKANTPNHAPCQCVDKILDKCWLTTISPYNPSVDVVVDGVYVKPSGYQIIQWCLKRFVRILIEENKSTLPYGKSFMLINILISVFFEKTWRNYIDNNKLPHSPDAIRLAKKKHGKNEEERLKNENRDALKSFSPGDDFPGRYDFIGYKDDNIYAIEVKVNSSELSHWQYIRLSLLKRFGCNILIINLSLTEEEINRAINGDVGFNYRYTISDSLPSSKIKTPSDDEFIRLMNYVPNLSNESVYE